MEEELLVEEFRRARHVDIHASFELFFCSSVNLLKRDWRFILASRSCSGSTMFFLCSARRCPEKKRQPHVAQGKVFDPANAFNAAAMVLNLEI